MFSFWKENNKVISKLILYQVGAAILGIALYFYLVYTMMWTVGGKDRIRVDTGRMEKDPSKPLVMALIANIPNFVLSAVYPIALYLFPSNTVIAGTGFVCRIISMMLQGYYIGLAETYFAVNPFTYLLTPFFAIGVTVAAYTLGYHNIRLTKKTRKQ